jgi:hypothetical protein
VARDKNTSRRYVLLSTQVLAPAVSSRSWKMAFRCAPKASATSTICSS